jgi:glutaredoxin 3
METDSASSSLSPPPVVIYTRQFCGFCTAAKRLLDGKGVTYVEHDATGRPELRVEMIQRANGRHTFPQIFIGDVHVGGFNELSQWEYSGALDKALRASEAPGALNGSPEPA